MSTYLIDGGSHIDRPLTNIAVKAFQGMEGFVGDQLFPAVPVGNQSDGYYVIDPDSWLRVSDTTRAPKTPAKRVEWKTSTDTYFARNFALATDHANETLANADQALRVRQTSTMFVLEMLARDREQRIANIVTSISNVGSGVALTGSNKWSDYASSDPIADVRTGSAFMRTQTGFKPNMLVVDEDTFSTLQHHPLLRDYIKYTQSGPIPMQMLQQIFGVERMLVAGGIVNNAKEGATASLTNIWGNSAVLAYVRAAQGLQTATFGLAMQWRPEGFPAPMVVERYDHHDRSRKAEVIEAQYFQDEKVVAANLAYTFTDTL